MIKFFYIFEIFFFNFNFFTFHLLSVQKIGEYRRFSGNQHYQKYTGYVTNVKQPPIKKKIGNLSGSL